MVGSLTRFTPEPIATLLGVELSQTLFEQTMAYTKGKHHHNVMQVIIRIIRED